MRCPNCQNELAETADRCPRCRHDRACLPPGRLLYNGKYRVENDLGRGGFGITYRATELRPFVRPVAIKELFPNSLALRDTTSGGLVARTDHRDDLGRAKERFLREGGRLADLHVPDRAENVVYVHDLFEDNDTAYLVMELLDGTPLDKVLAIPRNPPDAQGTPLSTERIVPIMDGLVRALTALHAKKLTHLDIKPANVMLRRNGSPVLIDFGAARTFGDATTSVVFLSWGYAPPELLRNQDVGPESDLYELGQTLYEMVTGRSCVNRRPGDLPEPWETLVTQATRENRADRPPSAQEWWEAMRPALSLATGSSTASGTPVHPIRKPQFTPVTPVTPVAAPAAGAATPTVALSPTESLARLKPTPPTPPGRRPLPAGAAALGVAVLAGAGLVGVMASQKNGRAPNSFAAPPSAAPPASAPVSAAAAATPPPPPSARTAPDATQTRRLISLLNRSEDEASWKKSVPAVEAAIKSGADPNARATTGSAPRLAALNWAAAFGEERLITLLLDRGADVNIKEPNGDTPLHAAAFYNRPSVVGLLLARGADPTAKNEKGQTPRALTTSAEVKNRLGVPSAPAGGL